jgi:hypothetical protein
MEKQTKEYLMIGGGLFVIGGGVFFGNKIYKKIKLKKDLKNYSKATLPGGKLNVIESARQIGLDLGTAYPAYDPRSWTENDNEVRDEVLKYPKTLIPRLKTEYAKLYSRDLQADLQKLLGSWAKVKHLFL